MQTQNRCPLIAGACLVSPNERSEMIVRSSELRQGDIVHEHGMRILLDRPILTAPGNGYGTCYYSLGLVLNRDEVPADVVPLSFTHYDDETEPRWGVQGNDNARWCIDRGVSL